MVKKKIVNILIVASIALLLSNVLIDVLGKKDNETLSAEISVSKIDSIFSNVINRFELKKEWIEIKTIKNDKIDSLKHVFYIKIPNDIPIATILKEMNYGFNKQPVEVTSEEKINYGKTVLKVYSNKKLKLQAFLNVDKDMQREFSRLSFILTDSESLSKDEFIKLMRIPYPFAVLLLPEEKSYNLLPQIYDFKKEVWLLLNDDVGEKKYSLDIEYEKQRLKNSILNIISDFPKVLDYVVDTESDLYKSTSYNFIKDEFTKRKAKLSNYNKFINIDRDTPKEIKSLIEFYVESGKAKGAKTFIITAENYLGLERALALMFNKGTKYPYPSSVN